jgi:DNA-binding XRE family transcriptional regulator
MEAHKSPKIEAEADKADASRPERDDRERTAQTSAERDRQDTRPTIEREDKSAAPSTTKDKSRARKSKNNVRKLRMERMMSKAELARRAGVSTLTIDRVERGMQCRMDTKRKILEALELKTADRVMVFGDAHEDPEVDD